MKVKPMESVVKKLQQERAVLGSRQGDPEAPASGTMLARRRWLQNELDHAKREQTNLVEIGIAPSSDRNGGTRHHRTVSSIERELARVDAEIGATQQRIAEIDALIAKNRSKSRD